MNRTIQALPLLLAAALAVGLSACGGQPPTLTVSDVWDISEPHDKEEADSPPPVEVDPSRFGPGGAGLLPGPGETAPPQSPSPPPGAQAADEGDIPHAMRVLSLPLVERFRQILAEEAAEYSCAFEEAGSDWDREEDWLYYYITYRISSENGAPQSDSSISFTFDGQTEALAFVSWLGWTEPGEKTFDIRLPSAMLSAYDEDEEMDYEQALSLLLFGLLPPVLSTSESTGRAEYNYLGQYLLNMSASEMVDAPAFATVRITPLSARSGEGEAAAEDFAQTPQ